MRPLQIEYVKDDMRRRGFKITKETTKRDICDLLLLPKKTSLKNISILLGVEYISVCGARDFNEDVPIGAISNRGDILSFNKMKEASYYFQTSIENIRTSISRDIPFPFDQTLWYFARL